MNLEEAIQARLTGDATLMALIPNGVWQGRAPQGTSRPYLLWQKVAPQPTEYTLTRKVSDSNIYQFVAYAVDTTTEGTASARSIIDRAEVVLMDAPLSVTGKNVLWLRKHSDIPDRFEEDNGVDVYGKGAEFRVETTDA